MRIFPCCLLTVTQYTLECHNIPVVNDRDIYKSENTYVLTMGENLKKAEVTLKNNHTFSNTVATGGVIC